MGQTTIEWTATIDPDGTVHPGYTFNPWIGCTRVSEGCRWCYAETLMDRRYQRVKWGPQGTRQRTSEANWRKPLQWNRQAERDGIRRKVFCASLADVFEDRPELWGWRVQLWHLIGRTPHLDWLLLTKRPENASMMTPTWWVPDWPANVWIGTSVEDQAAADARIPHLLRIPARVRFLSCEPLLGPINLSSYFYQPCNHPRFCGACDVGLGHLAIQWVIAGGESGHHARPMHPRWARALRDQCQAAGTPYFFKQWGEWIGGYDNLPYDLAERVHVGDVPEGLGMHSGDEAGIEFAMMYRFGKKAAGRLLDGREWNQFPSTEAVR